MKALDAEFVGNAADSWVVIVRDLANGGHVTQETVDSASLLWAFGKLIGNTDMHNGNLSFISGHGRPYVLAPAYDMIPMAFAPRSGGGLPDNVPPTNIFSAVDNKMWRRAIELAIDFVTRLRESTVFSQRFQTYITSLEEHIDKSRNMIAKLD